MRSHLLRSSCRWLFVILISTFVLAHYSTSIKSRGRVVDQSVLSQSNSAPQSNIVQSYAKLPLTFVPNEGQTDATVKFLSHNRGYTLFLTRNEAVFELHESSAEGSKYSGYRLQSRLASTTNAVLRMKLQNANPTAKITGLDEMPGKSNYFVGNPKMWRRNVSNYGKVKYKDIYSGIDLVYYGNQRQLEYDFVIAPGADPRRIEINICGAKHVSEDNKGDLVLQIGDSELRWHKPSVYQDEKGTRHRIGGKYVIRDGSRVGFELASYDSREPLVIDPTLTYSTYLGGTGFDQANAIAVDGSGNAYITGATGSVDFPITPGSLQLTSQGSNDVFVAKLNGTGSALLYSTYLGGSSGDNGYGIAVDASGEAYIVGSTQSNDFPITGNAFQQSCQSPCLAAFLSKLNAAGSDLVYSTYLGGGGDLAFGVSLDGSGNALLAGFTTSATFPTTPGGFQTAYNGGSGDGFVAKIDPSQSGTSSLVYSTYFGGGGQDKIYAIAVDSAGEAFVDGYTSSSDFPTTPGSFNTTFTGGQEFFIAKLNPTGTALAYSTYFGGSSSNYPNGIAVDSAGNAYIAGDTVSGIPTTPGAFQTQFSGTYDAFVAKINALGSSLLYSTYLHGSRAAGGAFAVAVDNFGDAYVTGFTNEADFPTLGSLQPAVCNPAGNPYACPDVFVTELSPDGKSLVFSTYLGGIGGEVAYGVAVDQNGNVYVVGHTFSSDFPTTPSSVDSTYVGGGDAFVSQLSVSGVGSANPTSLNFGNEGLHNTSAPQYVTLSNTGYGPLTINSISSTSADYSPISNCPISPNVLPVNNSCLITVRFKPEAVGTRTGSIIVTEYSARSTQIVNLVGNGVASHVTLSTTNLIFAAQLLGTTSGAKNIKLTNTSSTNVLNIAGISIAGDFTFASTTNPCPSSGGVPPSSSCYLAVRFSPTAVGNRYGAITIADSDPASPNIVGLSGTGTAVKLSTKKLNFGSILVGHTSSVKTITLSNLGTVALTGIDISVGGLNAGDFTQVNTCGSAVVAGGNCFINVTFTPSITGTESGTITIQNSDPTSPQAVTLIGTGT